MNSDNEAFHKKVVEEIEHYSSLENILISSIDFQNRLMKSIVSLLINKVSDKNKTLNIETIVKRLLDISKANNIEAEKVFLLLDRHQEKTFTYQTVFGLSEEFFHEAKKSESKIAKRIIDVFANHFKNANNDIWQPTFTNLDSKELSLLQIIEFKDWNSYAIEALKNKLVDVVGNNNNDNLNKIQPLAELLIKSSKSLDNTFKDVRDKFISTNAVTKEHFVAFVSLLFKYGSLKDKATDVVRVLFKSSFLDDLSCVGVMHTNGNELKTLLANCSETGRRDFEDGIKDRITKPEILKLAQILDIKIPKPKEEDKEE